MNRAPGLLALPAVCVRLITLRGSPADIPASTTLFALTLTVAAVLGVGARLFRLDVPLGHALLNVAIELGILLYGIWAVLQFKRLPHRFLQLATTLLGISVLGDTLTFVLLVVVGTNSSLAPLFLVPLSLQIVGFVYALHRGVDTSYLMATLLLLAYLIVTANLFAFSKAWFDPAQPETRSPTEAAESS